MGGCVGATHDFADEAYSRDWETRFSLSPGREALFSTIIDALKGAGHASALIVELGSGPGFFAERLLTAMPKVRYIGLDTSAPMRSLAATRLAPFGPRAKLMHADITSPDWQKTVGSRIGAIVTTWALHDLGGEAFTADVYRTSRAALAEGGMLINGDFVKPVGATQAYEPGRFTVARHVELLRNAGFSRVSPLGEWETELLNPTPSQNYACLAALP